MMTQQANTAMGVGVLLLFTLALTVTYGPFGAVAGLGLTAVWYLLSPLYAFAAAHIVLGALVSSTTIPELLALEAGILVAIFAPVTHPPQAVRTVAAGGIALLALGAIGMAGYQWFEGIRPATILLAASVVVVSYGLVRYEFVLRSLAEDANE